MRLKVSNVCQVFNKEEFIATTTKSGITFTNNGDGSFTINGTATANVFIALFKQGADITGFNINHKYLICGNLSNTIQIFETLSVNGTRHYEDSIFTCVRSEGYLDLRIAVGTTATNYVFRPQLFDLTEMYGAGNEPTTVAQFRQDFPNEMYEYSPECWKKFRRLKYVTETKNLFDVNNAVPYKFDNNPTTDEVFIKDGIYTTRLNNYNLGSGLRIKDGWTLPAGVYTLSVKVVDCADFGTNGFANTGFYYKTADGTWHALTRRHHSYAPGKTLAFATNIPEHIELRLYLNYQNMNGQWFAGYISYKDIQLEQGSTATPYQPYGYLPLRRGKYIANKEPVQLLDKSKYPATLTEKGVTFTNNGDGTITVNGTNNGELYYSVEILTSIPVGHKVIIDDRNSTLYFFGDMRTKDGVLIGTVPPRTIFTLPSNLAKLNMLYFVSYSSGVGHTYNNELSKPQLFDLTAMYGAGNEPTTVAQFRADFPNELYDYNPYNAITFR